MKRRDWRLTPEQRMDARRAFELIEATGRSLTEICERYLDTTPHLRPVEPISLHKLITRFLDAKRDKGLRGGSLEFYESHLWSFESDFPKAVAGYFTSTKLNQYFKGHDGKGGGRAPGKEAKFRAVRALFNWAAKQEPCPLQVNPVVGVTVPRPPRDKEVAFYGVEQVRKIMKAAKSPHQEALALGFFCGLRPSEIAGGYGKEGLRWENVRRDDKFIRVPSHVAKGSANKQNARLLEDIPANFWRWIKDAPTEGKVYPYGHRQLTDHINRVCKVPVVYDGVRHSFATYHVAKFRDPGKTSLILGHRGSTAILRDHYLGLATKAEGEAFFSILPQ